VSLQRRLQRDPILGGVERHRDPFEGALAATVDVIAPSLRMRSDLELALSEERTGEPDLPVADVVLRGHDVALQVRKVGVLVID
jgi:hypothetical protein